MKMNSPAGAIAVGMVIVAGLMTLMFEGGWFVWIPLAAALLLVWGFTRMLG